MAKIKTVFTVGGGLAGLCAMESFDTRGITAELIEPNPEVGGLCRSWQDNGCTLDYGPHIVVPPTVEAEDWFSARLNGSVKKCKRNDCVRIDGEEYPYPIQKALVERVTEDYTGDPINYRQYVLKHFGKVLSKAFFEPYNSKMWKHSLASLSADLLGGRSPSPVSEDQNYLYPAEGGMGAFVGSFHPSMAHYGSVELLDTENRKIVFTDGREERYEWVVWTGSLKGLEAIWVNRPSGLRFDLLCSVGLYLVNIFVGRRLPMQWLALYVPDPMVPFHRLSLPHVIGPQNVPGNMTVVQCEVTAEGPISLSRLSRETVDGLARLGYVAQGDVTNVSVRYLPEGYPVPGLATMGTASRIEKELSVGNVLLAGRAGRWIHMNLWSVKEDVDETVRRMDS